MTLALTRDVTVSVILVEEVVGNKFVNGGFWGTTTTLLIYKYCTYYEMHFTHRCRHIHCEPLRNVQLYANNGIESKHTSLVVGMGSECSTKGSFHFIHKSLA